MRILVCGMNDVVMVTADYTTADDFISAAVQSEWFANKFETMNEKKFILNIANRCTMERKAYYESSNKKKHTQKCHDTQKRNERE